MASAGPPDHFSTRHLHDDLGRRSIRGGAVSFAAQGTKLLLSFGAIMILARLLTPEDFGLIGMVASIIGFGELFKELGLSVATVRSEQIDHAQVSTLFWINVLVSVTLCGVNAMCSPVVAWLYGDARVAPVMAMLGIAFVFGGLTSQHQAILRRRMQLLVLAGCEIASLATGLLTAIALSLYGFGYWSLVAQGLVAPFVTMICVWMSCGWRPSRPRRRTRVREMIRFGGFLTGSDILHFAMRNTDNILIGVRWGAAELGLYTRAYSLLLLPIRQVNAPLHAVVLPALSRLQGNPAEFSAYYRRAVLLSAAIGMPIVAFFFVAADELVSLLLGRQWTGSVPVFQALAPAAWVGTTSVATSWVYLALGETKRILKWALMSVPLQIGGYVVGLAWGAVGVACAFSVVSLCLQPVNIWYCYRSTFLRPGTFYRTVYFPALASVLAVAVALVAKTFLTAELSSAALKCAVLFGIFATTYCAPWLVLPSRRVQVARVAQAAVAALRGRRESYSAAL